MSPFEDTCTVAIRGAMVFIALGLSACHSGPTEQAPTKSASRTALAAASLPAPPQPSIDPPQTQTRASMVPGHDGTLAAMVEAALLAEPELRAAAIDVTAVDGTVFLRGKAKDRSARRLATQIATSVDGVKRVQNELFVTAGS